MSRIIDSNCAIIKHLLMRLIKIGSDQSNDIHKGFENDPTVSRIHCEIFLDDEGNIFLKDKESTNGTFVNGNKISEPQMLDELDVVRVGNSVVDWKGFIMNEGKELNQNEKLPSENSIEIIKNSSQEETEKKPIQKNSLSKYFSFQNEYISGGTYWLRVFLQQLLTVLFGLGLYLIAVTVYKRAKSLQCSDGVSIFLALLIPIGNLISLVVPYASLFVIVAHGYLWFSDGNKQKFKQTLNIQDEDN